VIRNVATFQELVTTPFAGGVNALCWERNLRGDFGEVVRLLRANREPLVEDGEIMTIDESRLGSLKLTPYTLPAVTLIREDLRLLRELGRDPVLNLIAGYPRDEDAAVVPTDVFSWHADSAPIEADTWLCTYHGAPSEGLRNEDAIRKVDVPEIRNALLKEFGGSDGEEFRTWLSENCYDLHFAPRNALSLSNGPYSFGLGHLWRIAVDWPGSAVLPCIHRAPATIVGEPRLMLIC
jgi:hypothetical protein